MSIDLYKRTVAAAPASDTATLGQKGRRPHKGSLLLVFLFTTGLLGLLVTGLYFVVTTSTLQQAQNEQEAAKRKVDVGLEQVHQSELNRLIKDYVDNFANTPPQTLVAGFDTTSYRDALDDAANWAFNTGTLKEAAAGNPGGLTVTLPNQVASPPFAKANALAAGTDFREHPLSFARGTSMTGTLSGTFTPTWSDKAFSYSRSFVAYREIPVVHLPFSAAYNVGSLSKLDSVSFSGGPWVLLGGDTTHADAVVAADYGSLAAAPNLPELKHTYGYNNADLTDSTHQNFLISEGFDYLAYTDAELQQRYAADPEVIYLTFNGTTVVVDPGSPISTTVPAAITIGSFDGRSNRLIVDLATLPTTGDYAYKKWYIHCSGALNKSRGVILKDTGNDTGAAASVSIATNGQLYLWQYKRDDKTPVMAATNFGAVGLADGGFDGTTASMSLNFSWRGGVSAYSKRRDEFSYDEFDRAGTFPTGVLMYVPTYDEDGLEWSTTRYSGTMTCSSTGDGSLTASTNDAWCYFSMFNSIQYGVYGAEITTTSFSNSKELHLILTNAISYNDASSNRVDMWVGLDGSGNLTANADYRISSVTTSHSVSVPGYSAGTHVWGFFFAPGSNEVYITLDGALILKKRLAGVVHTTSSLSYSIMKFDDGITITRWEQVRNPFGTVFSSPQTAYSGTDAAIFYGGVAVGDGFSSSLDSGASVNFQYKSAVGTALENYCERVLVHYPYFYKP